MCHLLQYLCDCQVRHRIEAVVAFSDDFVASLQDNQRFRYNEVMQALNMSAALTARKTKEFRSPPQEQVSIDYVLNYVHKLEAHMLFLNHFLYGCLNVWLFVSVTVITYN